MAKRQNRYRILGHVIDRTTQQGTVGLRVEAWDKDLIFDDLIGSAVTDADGRFEIEFTEAYFSEIFIDRRPDPFFNALCTYILSKSAGIEDLQ